MSRVRLAGLTALVCLLSFAVVDAGPAAPRKAPQKLPKHAAVGIYVLGPRALISGTLASYRVALHWTNAPEVTGPLPGAQVELALERAASDDNTATLVFQSKPSGSKTGSTARPIAAA